MFSILQRIFPIVLEPPRHNEGDRSIEKEIFALIRHAIVLEYTSPFVLENNIHNNNKNKKSILLSRK